MSLFEVWLSPADRRVQRLERAVVSWSKTFMAGRRADALRESLRLRIELLGEPDV